MAPNECYLVVWHMQVYGYEYNRGVRASIIRKLPLGCLIDNNKRIVIRLLMLLIHSS
jgi:hypothetical protein